MLMWEMCTFGSEPFRGLGKEKMLREIKESESRPPRPEDLADTKQRLVKVQNQSRKSTFLCRKSKIHCKLNPNRGLMGIFWIFHVLRSNPSKLLHDVTKAGRS